MLNGVIGGKELAPYKGLPVMQMMIVVRSKKHIYQIDTAPPHDNSTNQVSQKHFITVRQRFIQEHID